ncbi:MAG TPA: hypothetical protein VI318_15175 [Baekduia sp.]
MSLIPELERELEAMAERRRAATATATTATPATAATAAPRRRLSRRRLSRRRLVLALVAALLLAATAALAAGGVIPIGPPTHDSPGSLKPKPNTFSGTVVPGTAKVLALRVPDPDGGPPWGVRMSVTTRSLGCLHPGRVVGGQVGALGQDDVFGNDGRFHPFPADHQLMIGACAQLDANRRLFTASIQGGLPAAGTTENGACSPAGTVTGDPTVRFCPDADERTLAIGALGPNARTITYIGDDGAPHVQQLARPYGVYLIVRRGLVYGVGAGTTASLYGTPNPNPYNTTITKVTFADGTSCPVTREGWATPDHQCPQLGFTPHPRPSLTTADVRSPVHARLEHRDGQRVMVIHWRARVAIPDATTAYYVTRRRRGSRGWGSGPTQRNIRKGEIAEKVWYSPIPGTYRGRVTYMWFGPAPEAQRELVVGSYTLKVPPPRRKHG